VLTGNEIPGHKRKRGIPDFCALFVFGRGEGGTKFVCKDWMIKVQKSKNNAVNKTI
jgi:hypothetical protein